MTSATFEPTIPAIELVLTYIVGLKATGIGSMKLDYSRYVRQMI